MGNVGKIEKVSTVDTVGWGSNQKSLDKSDYLTREFFKGTNKMGYDMQDRWNRIGEGGSANDFWDQLIIGAQDIGGEVANFFAPGAVTTRAENTAKFNAKRDSENAEAERRVKMIASNIERDAMTGATAGMQSGQTTTTTPRDFTTDTRVFNTNLGDKK